jgi:hypothetical protein
MREFKVLQTGDITTTRGTFYAKIIIEIPSHIIITIELRSGIAQRPSFATTPGARLEKRIVHTLFVTPHGFNLHIQNSLNKAASSDNSNAYLKSQ